MILLSHSNSSIKGTEMLGYILSFFFTTGNFCMCVIWGKTLLFSTLILGSVFSDMSSFTGWPYRGSGLSYQRQIWHNGENWPSEPYRQLKFPCFKNPRWLTVAILLTVNRYISATAWLIITQLATMTHTVK